MIERLEALRDDLTQSIEKLKQRTASPAASVIQFLTLPAQTVYCRKGAFNGVEERKEFLREVFMEAIHLYGSDSSMRMFFIEYNLEHPEEFTCCISVPPASKKALGIFYHGCYESLPDARRELSAYAAAQNLSLSGTVRHTYLEGPPQHKDPANFITQVALVLQ